jgi:H(+)-translocating pyrophosphatase
MFARVGGGVFTKAADVGSDLVGKVEQGIPEDDPRNPAVIADNVGDNVGDVAGMGADLFESYVGAIIATAALAPRLAAQFADTSLGAADYQADFNAIMHAGIALPFWINGGGILASLIGIAAIRNTTLPDGTTLEALLTTITNGVLIASAVTTVFTAGIVWALFKGAVAWKLFGATVIGLIAGVVIGKFTEYCTAYEFTPTREIAEASAYGPAPVIIKGMGVGLLSVSVPMISTVVTILACNVIAGQYAVAIAAVGLLSTLGITLATDAYGPVADNAGGIAEMAQLPPEVRSRTDALDSLGNTTAATGKGLAIASATLTAVGLIAAFVEQSGLTRTTGSATGITLNADATSKVADLSDAVVLAGVLVGAGLPMIFAALTMLSVDRGARAIITEVRLQFATAPLLMKGALTQVVNGHTYPDSTRCVVIATEAAIQEMILPGVLAVFVPVAVGFLLGPKGTCGMLAGALGGCFMRAFNARHAAPARGARNCGPNDYTTPLP